MNARMIDRGALAVAASVLAISVAHAGGGHGGSVVRPGGGFHGGFGGFRGGWAGGGRTGGSRGLPPVAGVIDERGGMRPYFSAYGHTNTAARFGAFQRGGVPGYGHTATALPFGGARALGGGYGYGHVGTALRIGSERRFGVPGEGRRRFAERRGFAGGGYGGYGGFGGGYGFGDGTYGAPGIYGDAGVYGGQGTYGTAGSYGQPGTYGGGGTTATQSSYGTGGGTAYRSEVPLAARFAEPPLGPSPYAPYSPGDRYAYAASEDVGPGPRVLNPYRRSYRGAAADCACGSGVQPTFYRYGIGTAY
jgi:hypothetical protein